MLTAGWIAKDQADLKSAEAFLTDAVTLAREVGDENVLVHGVLFLGHAALECGDFAEYIMTIGGCNNAPDGPGEPGDFACIDLQFAAHLQ